MRYWNCSVLATLKFVMLMKGKIQLGVMPGASAHTAVPSPRLTARALGDVLAEQDASTADRATRATASLASRRAVPPRPCADPSPGPVIGGNSGSSVGAPKGTGSLPLPAAGAGRHQHGDLGGTGEVAHQ